MGGGRGAFFINVSSASPFTSLSISFTVLFSPPLFCLASLWPPPSPPSNRFLCMTSFPASRSSEIASIGSKLSAARTHPDLGATPHYKCSSNQGVGWQSPKSRG
ncbi:hypothetical protein RHMOL_Rhmol13G0125800 [Rhododendron molle]|uniref:Uncharacterized protein n=1 Tax=Rhododendron molle TaxID=49168 RepID=A0ACC0L7D1_RHOML|nr:hypothetical protein RHMOL_Rhmol13G0125800 [Rhododendron molle]